MKDAAGLVTGAACEGKHIVTWAKVAGSLVRAKDAQWITDNPFDRPFVTVRPGLVTRPKYRPPLIAVRLRLIFLCLGERGGRGSPHPHSQLDRPREMALEHPAAMPEELGRHARADCLMCRGERLPQHR